MDNSGDSPVLPDHDFRNFCLGGEYLTASHMLQKNTHEESSIPPPISKSLSFNWRLNTHILGRLSEGPPCFVPLSAPLVLLSGGLKRCLEFQGAQTLKVLGSEAIKVVWGK